MSKLVSNGLKIKFNLNEYIVKFCNGKAIAIAPRERNLYEINFVKVHEAEAANLVQFPTGDDTLEVWYNRLGHLNLKGVYPLQNMVINMIIGKFSCFISSLLCKTHHEAFEGHFGF